MFQKFPVDPHTLDAIEASDDAYHSLDASCAVYAADCRGQIFRTDGVTTWEHMPAGELAAVEAAT